ncbi:unnamed protein product [Cuscuta europaea]|uniref:Uncharacterized protein n=2 Tax=Cuscuta europaea TaxID=41803 RepID=A0A9P0ZZ87_CUSEU|nr:unnamed protein product [Cuscuta europaea]
MYVIADAVGSFVQWPARLVIFEGEEPQFQQKKKEMKKKQTPFVERDPPKVTVAPSICPLVSESILDTLTDDVLELHEALQWFELENCKFSVHLSTDVFCFQEDRPFGATIDRDELSRFLEGDSLEICIIQTFMVCLKEKLVELGRDDIGFLCPHLCSSEHYKLDKKGTMTYLKHALIKSFEKSFIFLPYHEG